MKLIVDLMYEGGMENVRYSISNTANLVIMYLDHVSSLQKLKQHENCIRRYQNGNFANRFVKDNENGFKEFYQLREQQHGHEIEAVVVSLRNDAIY